MADKWGSHEKAVAELLSEGKAFNTKVVKDHLEDFAKSYKKCQELEGKLGHMAVKARANGIAGTDLKDFKRDSGFYDTYKTLDREADELAKAQKGAWIGSNYARAGLNDIKTLSDKIEKDLSKLKDELADAQAARKKNELDAKQGKATLSPAIQKQLQGLEKEFKEAGPLAKKLLESLETLKKDLTEAGGLYRKQVDQRMENYLDKFERMVEKIIDIAPADNKRQEGLPTALQPNVLGVAVKKAHMQHKAIMKYLKAATAKAKIDPKFAKADMKAAKDALEVMKKTTQVQDAHRKKFESHIKRAKNSSDLYRQFRVIDEELQAAQKGFDAAEALLKDAEKKQA